MTDADASDDANDEADADSPDEIDVLFDAILGERGLPDEAPAWSGHVARLVSGARAPAEDGELASEDDVVARMVALRAGVATAARPDAATDPHRPRHARRSSEQPRHASARAPVTVTPTVRGVGRVLAFKAAAVTTAVVVGTVAAAAATTGIVATVVVPAFTEGTPTAPVTKTPGTATDDRDARGADADRPRETVPEPACASAPACDEPAPTVPSTEPPPPRPSSTAVPHTDEPATSTTVAPTAATTTTVEAAPPTTQPPPTTTSTTETPPVTPAEAQAMVATSTPGAPVAPTPVG